MGRKLVSIKCGYFFGIDFFVTCRIEKAEESENKCWYVLMLLFSIVFYVGSLVGIILLFVFFTEVIVYLVVLTD